MAADLTPKDDRLRAALFRESRGRILREGPITELSLLVVMLVVIFLAYGNIPRLWLTAWALAVAATVAFRVLARRRLARADYDIAGRRRFRAAVLASALAWGIGCGVFVHLLPLEYTALVMVIVAGLVAAAATTLAAESLTFRIFLPTVLLPLAIGILAAEVDRSRFVALAVIGIFALGTMAVHERAYAQLLASLRVNLRMEDGEALARREHAHLDALFASAPVATAVVDAAGLVHDVNPFFELLFGYTKDELLGKRLNDFIVPPSEQGHANVLDETVRGGERVVAEVRRCRKDGQIVQVRASAARVRNVDTDEQELFVLYEDVSDEVRARAALLEAKEGAERLAQLRSVFLANMSHEIRTPMNAVLGLTELLLDSDLSVEQRRALNLIESSGEALLTLLNDVLDLSKIEADGLRLETVPFDLHHLVDSTVSLLAVRAREHKIELLTEIAPPVPEQVRGDPTRLRQVLTNLIGNAIKFTHQGEVLVTLTSEGSTDGRATVRFAVKDTGIGIREDQRVAIFQPFRQADLSTTRKYGGTGLGLTIARRLVEMMGGQLQLESEVGKGSEFSFAIDLAVEATVPVPLPVPSAVQLAGRTMLVVDDNQSNRRIVREMLAAAGVAVEEATDADEGLAALRRAAAARTPYALAILDAQMPGRDGFQLAQIVRADATLKATPLMMLSSVGERGDGQRCRELGIHGYLTKPVSRGNLVEMVASVLGNAAQSGASPEVVTRHRILESRRHLRILLAEDNLVNQEVAATMLRKRGHHVDVADNGRQAVDLAARERYDVVLMDIQMPEMDGYEATAAIRATATGRDLPIVALTAHALADERDRILAAGMNATVTKPFKAFDLFAAAEGWGLGSQAAAPAAAATQGEPPVALDKFRREMIDADVGEAVDGILQTFLEGEPQRIVAITAAVVSGQAEEVARLAHTFKSSAGQVGAHRLAELLAEMEQASKQGSMDVVKDLLGKLALEAEKVARYLEGQRK
jgi:two-component system sensor histidine kinase/response regulator